MACLQDSNVDDTSTPDCGNHATLPTDLDATVNIAPLSYKPYVEDVPDEDDPVQFVQQYPHCESEVLGNGTTIFEQWKTQLEETGGSQWTPFASWEEWELAQWLRKCVGHNQIEEFLKLPIMSNDLYMQYCETYHVIVRTDPAVQP